MSPVLDIYSVSTAVISLNKLSIPIQASENGKKIVKTLGLIDSGARGKFIDQNFVRKAGIRMQNLETPMKAWNVDGTENKQGTIRQFVNLDLKINRRSCNTRLLVTRLGNEQIILGFPWLAEHNLDINWRMGEFKWRDTCEQRFFKNLPMRKGLQGNKEVSPKPTVDEIPDEEEWINAKTTTLNEFHQKHDEKKDDLPVEEQVPVEYHEFLDVFNEVKADQFPESRTWDHKIEMKPGFEPKSFKTYNLTPEEQVELEKFLKENLDKRVHSTISVAHGFPLFLRYKKGW